MGSSQASAIGNVRKPCERLVNNLFYCGFMLSIPFSPLVVLICASAYCVSSHLFGKKLHRSLFLSSTRFLSLSLSLSLLLSLSPTLSPTLSLLLSLSPTFSLSFSLFLSLSLSLMLNTFAEDLPVQQLRTSYPHVVFTTLLLTLLVKALTKRNCWYSFTIRYIDLPVLKKSVFFSVTVICCLFQ